MTTNAMGTLNLLDLMKKYSVKKFVLASTSSLYAGQPMPFVETLPVNTPISPYAASKKAAEVMAYSYHYLYDIDITINRKQRYEAIIVAVKHDSILKLISNKDALGSLCSDAKNMIVVDIKGVGLSSCNTL